MDKPTIEYPCAWPYKIIGMQEALIQAAVVQLLDGRDFSLKTSHHSTKGKYVSFNLVVQVCNEVQRNEIFAALQNLPSVVMVI